MLEPRAYKGALKVAKNKEWKLRRVSQLGMESLSKRLESKQMGPMPSQALGQVHHVLVVPVTSQVMLAMVTAIVSNVRLRQDMR